MSVRAELVEKRNELNAVNEKMKKTLEESKVGQDDYDFTKASTMEGDKDARFNQWKKWKAESEALGKEVDRLVEIERGIKAVNDEQEIPLPQPREEGKKTLGELFVKSREYQDFKNNQLKVKGFTAEGVSLKTLMTTAAGFAPQAIRTGEIVPYAFEPVGLFQTMPKATTGQTAIAYMEQTTRTNNAAGTAEGDNALGESAFAYTPRSVTVELVGHWLPVSDQQLEDVAQMEELINTDMINMLVEKLDEYAITGSGSTPVPRGFLNVSGIGSINATGKKIPDAIYNAMTAIRVNGKTSPDRVVIHPENWESIRLSKTLDGQYIWGSPALPGPDRIWGLQVIPTTRITLGTAGVGNFANFSKWWERRGVTVEMSDSHSDHFIKNLKAIRATVRGAFVWTRPAAFAEVTNI